MRLRAYGLAVHGFLDTIRERHPNTPLPVVSPIYRAIHEATGRAVKPDVPKQLVNAETDPVN